MSYPRNAATPPAVDLGAIVQVSDGALQTSGASVRVRTGTGAWGAGGGTLACDATSGIWTYVPTQGETDDTYFVVGAYKSGCVSVSRCVITSAQSVPGKVDVGAISGDATAADNAEAFFDGTGYAGTGNVIPIVTNVTNTPSFNGPSAATIADAVWDELLADHLTLNTTGYFLGETHSTGDLLYTDWENGGRLDLILDARASQSSVDDIPTVAELEARTLVAASYGTATNQATIAGYLDTEVAAILAAVDTEVAAIKAKTDQLTFTVANQVDSNALSGGSGLDAAGVRAAVGLASANLDTQLADIPTVSEFNARTLAAAAYFDPGADTVTTTDAASVAAIKAKTDQLVFTVANQVDANALTVVGTVDDAVLSAIAALNNLSAAQVNAECDTALSDVGVTLARMGALTDWIDGGRLDLILDTIASNVAAVLLDTGTDGVVLNAALCNKIADHVRRRTQANVEASSDGDALSKSSHYGAIQQIQKSNTTDTAGLLTIKKTDGTTLGTLTLASDAAAEPATGVS